MNQFPVYAPFYLPTCLCHVCVGLNHALETFGAKSVCVQHSEHWKITNIAGHVHPAPEWGAGCYNVSGRLSVCPVGNCVSSDLFTVSLSTSNQVLFFTLLWHSAVEINHNSLLKSLLQ